MQLSFVTSSSILDSSLSLFITQFFLMNKFATNWAVKYNIFHSVVNGQLKGLKKYTCLIVERIAIQLLVPR